MTSSRLDYSKVAPGVIGAMLATNRFLDTCSVDPVLRRLVELRVSQINGCGYCIWLHTRQLADLDVSDQRIAALPDWRSSDQFDAADRAALEWIEAVTAIAAGKPSDALYQEMREHFQDVQIVEITATAANMNALNRMAISFEHEAPDD